VTAYVFTLATPITDLIAPTIVLALGHANDRHTPDGWGTKGIIAGVLTIGAFVAGLVALFGLFRFQTWARPLAVSVPCALVASYIVVGEVSQSGLGVATSLTAFALWGAAISLAYYGEPADLFTNRS
jgi:hypothetical protein